MFLQEETLLEVLGLAHQFGFVELETSISDHLKAILNVRNVCLIYDIASMYSLRTLCQTCFEFMDRNAAEVIKSTAFLSLSGVGILYYMRYCKDIYTLCPLQSSLFLCQGALSPLIPSHRVIYMKREDNFSLVILG